MSLVTPLVLCIDISDKARLVTLVNITSIIKVLREFESAMDSVEQIEEYEKKVLMSSVAELVNIIRSNCYEIQIPCGFDVT